MFATTSASPNTVATVHVDPAWKSRPSHRNDHHHHHYHHLIIIIVIIITITITISISITIT